jgi:hypothetical protein
MVKCIFWTSIFVNLGKLVVAAPKSCANLGVGIICGAACCVGVQLFTGDALNDAAVLGQAA